MGATGLLGWLLARPSTPYAALVVPMAAVGFGTAFTMPESTAAVMESAPDGRHGAASAAFNLARQMGSAIGAAIFGTLIAGGMVAGLHIAVTIGGLVSSPPLPWRPASSRSSPDARAECGG